MYEIWDMVSYGDGEEPMPFSLIYSHESFLDVWEQFKKFAANNVPCVVMYNKKESQNGSAS